MPHDAHNQYAGRSRAAALRRDNLDRYLSQMLLLEPSTLLVGEAPSHRGCRLTGIPFMSETLMLRGVEGAGLFGEARGYEKATRGDRLSTEASATIVWETIGSLRPTPLLWNAFPFHPHHPGEPRSNRPPTAAELEIGKRFVVDLVEIFAIDQVVAVGNRARDSLTALRILHARVRHPSRGGKREFAAGIARLCKNS
ncbi:MAG: uracil-DNA glycosylase [Acidobacteria bacterium]|nr:uracil-DNA glycosylase [Acidobacteriota bacterium]